MIIGITKAGTLADELNRLNAWLGLGHNGRMSFLARDSSRRCDPCKVMPGCKTVIVCAMKYDEIPKKQSLKDKNQKTKYLRHEDYHKAMMEKLEDLAGVIRRQHPDAGYRCYVDTGPVLEKAWGARAGLGFIGKNTLLISTEHGSQMALGVVLTSIEKSLVIQATRGEQRLPAGLLAGATSDKQRATNCNSCTACLDACPTGALAAPYILDARRCISYKFFIEKKEGGCDICQDVCPFNRRESIWLSQCEREGFGGKRLCLQSRSFPPLDRSKL